MSPKLFYPRGFYAIVLTTEISNETQRIFELLWRKEIYNAVILYDSKDAVTTLGFDSFTPTNCGNVEVIEIKDLTSYFFDKHKNLKGCSINVHCPYLSPFVYLENNEAAGRDVDLMKILEKALNFKLKLKVLKEEGTSRCSCNC